MILTIYNLQLVSIKRVLRKNTFAFRILRFLFHNTRYFIFLFLLIFDIRFINKLIYFRGSRLEIFFIKHQLIKSICNLSDFKIESLRSIATYCYLNGYFYIAKFIYLHIFNRVHSQNKDYPLKGLQNFQRIFTPQFFSAIGHMAYIDTFLKEDFMKYRHLDYNILSGSANDYSNQNLFHTLFNTISKHPSTTNLNSESLVQPLIQELSFISGDKIEWFDEWAWRIQEKWIKHFDHKVLSSIDDHITHNAIDKLKTLGIDKNRWFVVVHLRENSGTSLMDLRDVKAKSYLKALHYIIDQGGVVFRIGTSNLHNEININSNSYIDLTKDIKLQNTLDLYLLSKCRFFLGTGSGPSSIASQVFHRPLLSTNISPMASRIPFDNHLILPKTYTNKRTGRVLNYCERINHKFGNLESSMALDRLGYSAKDNSEFELLESCKEMLSLTTEGKFYNSIRRLETYKSVMKIQNQFSNRYIAPCGISNITTILYPDFLTFNS